MSESPRKPRNIVRFREREVARITKAVRETVSHTGTTTELGDAVAERT